MRVWVSWVGGALVSTVVAELDIDPIVCSSLCFDGEWSAIDYYYSVESSYGAVGSDAAWVVDSVGRSVDVWVMVADLSECMCWSEIDVVVA